MTIKEIKINDLKEYENNPRTNDEAVEKVASSIKEFGFKVPIVIDKNNVIIAGHTRLKAAKLLNLEMVPCVIADNLTDEQVKAYRLADNKVGELAEWDYDLLDKEIQKVGFENLSNYGFEQFEVKENSEKTSEEVDEGKVQCPRCGEWVEV